MKAHTLDDFQAALGRESQFPNVAATALDQPRWVVAWEGSDGQTKTSQTFGLESRAWEHLREIEQAEQAIAGSESVKGERWERTRRNLRVIPEPHQEFSGRG